MKTLVEFPFSKSEESKPIKIIGGFSKKSVNESLQVTLESIYDRNYSIGPKQARRRDSIMQLSPDIKQLQKQVNYLQELLDQENNKKQRLIDEIISARLHTNEELLDILFDLYEKGLLSISEVKKRGGINQYQFVYMLSERDMSFVYPEENITEQEERLKKARELL